MTPSARSPRITAVGKGSILILLTMLAESKESMDDIEAGGNVQSGANGEERTPLPWSTRSPFGSPTNYYCAFLSIVAIAGTAYAAYKGWNAAFCVLFGVMAFTVLCPFFFLQFQSSETKNDITDVKREVGVVKCEVHEVRCGLDVVNRELGEVTTGLKTLVVIMAQSIDQQRFNEKLVKIDGDNGVVQSMEKRIDDQLAAISEEIGGLQSMEDRIVVNLESSTQRIDEKLATISGENGTLQEILNELRNLSSPETDQEQELTMM